MRKTLNMQLLLTYIKTTFHLIKYTFQNDIHNYVANKLLSELSCDLCNELAFTGSKAMSTENMPCFLNSCMCIQMNVYEVELLFGYH